MHASTNAALKSVAAFLFPSCAHNSIWTQANAAADDGLRRMRSMRFAKHVHCYFYLFACFSIVQSCQHNAAPSIHTFITAAVLPSPPHELKCLSASCYGWFFLLLITSDRRYQAWILQLPWPCSPVQGNTGHKFFRAKFTWFECSHQNGCGPQHT